MRGKKKLVLIGVLVGVVVLACIFYFIKQDNRNKEQSTLATEFILKEGKNDIQIKVETATGLTWLYENGEQQELLSSIKRKPNTVIELPSTKEVYDIVSENEPDTDLTWKSSLLESKQYLNYLMSKGYSLERELYTSSYSEFIVSEGTNRKRIIILPNTMMVGDLEQDAILQDKEDYIDKYRK